MALWAVNATACVPVNRVGPDADDPGWPAYLGSPRHDASVAESLADEPREMWRTDVGRAVRGSPAVGASVIAVGTSDRAVVLLDRATGAVIWRRRVPGPVAGGPLLSGSFVYAATQAAPDGRVVALRVRNGAQVWSARTGGISAPLALVGDQVIAATDAGEVVALDRASGASRWRRRVGRAARAAPVPTAHGVAVATIVDSLYLLDAATGAIRARCATPGTVLGAPATDGRHLFLATTAGRLLALSLPGLAVAWDRGTDDPVYGAPALAGDTLYVVTGSGTLWRLEVNAAASGPTRSIAVGVPASAGPTPIVGGVLIGGVTGEVVWVDTAGDSVRWRTRRRGPIEEPPLVRDRQLIFVSGNGTVEAYR